MSDPVMRGGSGYSVPRDANRVPAMFGVSSADGVTPLPLEIDPITGLALVGAPTWSGYPLGGTNAALTGLQTVSAAAGKFGGYATLINLNSTPVYIQVFDSTSTVTLGVTEPTYIVCIPANTTAANGFAANVEISNGLVIVHGIQVAATTTSNGGSTVGTGLTGTILYK